MHTLDDIDSIAASSSRRTLKHSYLFAVAVATIAACLPASAFAQAGNQDNANNQIHNYAPRIVMFVQRARNVVFDEPVISVTVLDPELVKTELKAPTVVTFTGLAEGETIAIIS